MEDLYCHMGRNPSEVLFVTVPYVNTHVRGVCCCAGPALPFF